MCRYKIEEITDIKEEKTKDLTKEMAKEQNPYRKKPSLLELLQDESGIGVIEIVLILVVLIGLVIIFKNQINTLLQNIFEQIESLSESVY